MVGPIIWRIAMPLFLPLLPLLPLRLVSRFPSNRTGSSLLALEIHFKMPLCRRRPNWANCRCAGPEGQTWPRDLEQLSTRRATRTKTRYGLLSVYSVASSGAQGSESPSLPLHLPRRQPTRLGARRALVLGRVCPPGLDLPFGIVHVRQRLLLSRQLCLQYDDFPTPKLTLYVARPIGSKACSLGACPRLPSGRHLHVRYGSILEVVGLKIFSQHGHTNSRTLQTPALHPTKSHQLSFQRKCLLLVPGGSPQTPVLASLVGIIYTPYGVYKPSEARTGVWGGTPGGGGLGGFGLPAPIVVVSVQAVASSSSWCSVSGDPWPRV